ncbi:hypothetical protein D3C76_1267350 [compost metagenome]
MEMVLGNPGRIKPRTLGMADLFCRQAIALFGRGIIQQAGKESQAFTRHAYSSVTGEKWGMASISSRV